MKVFPQSLALEILEDRTLMSTCHVTRLSDVGAGMGFRGDLRYCINKVNAEPGADAIDFRVTGTIRLTAALPDLDDELTILGPGIDKLTIDGQGIARHFYIEEGADVDISGLVLTNGFIEGTPGVNGEGGAAVYNEGTLSLNHCAISNNTAKPHAEPLQLAPGGAIYNEGILSIFDCSITQNTTTGFIVAAGGIYNEGDLVVDHSHVTNNVVSAICCYSGYAQGGAIYNSGTATIIDSTLASNSAVAGYNGYGGAVYNKQGGELVIDSSLIWNNRVIADGSFGGGLYNNDGNLIISNSTVLRNLVTTGPNDPYDSDGGGIWHRNGSLTISHSTIAGNIAQAEGGGIYDNTQGPGVVIHMHNTIVADNFSGNSQGNDLWSVELTTSSYNLIEDPIGGGGYSETDLLNVDPMLGPVQDNGGLTWTTALAPGSPAIDAGDNTNAPEFDQRGPGFPRIVNGTIDIGAFEVQATGAPSQLRSLALLVTADLNADD